MPTDDTTAALTLRETWGARVWGAVARALSLTNPVERPQAVEAGGDFAAGAPVQPIYSPTVALSADLQPYVHACVKAITDDLASLPIRVTRRGEQVDGHWVGRMLANSGISASHWRRVSVRDMLLVGRTLSIPIYGSRKEPAGIRHQVAARVRAVPAADGTVLGWDIGMDVIKQYRPEDVVAVFYQGFEDGPELLNPIGATRVLHDDLVADQQLARAAARSASSGRPSAMYRPKAEGAWNAKQVEIIRIALAKMFSANDGGVAVIGEGNADLDILGWAPREMEGPQQRAWIRQAIMAVLGVPPVRLGVDGANTWATSEAQLTSYWTNLQGTIAPLDEALTMLARRIDGDETIEVAHDFSGTPALQAAQSATLDRIGKHIQNGMTPAAAYAYEGWNDVTPDLFSAPPSPTAPVPQTAPVAAAEAPSAAPADAADGLPADEAAAHGAALADALAVLADPDASPAQRAEAMADLDAIAAELASYAEAE